MNFYQIQTSPDETARFGVMRARESERAYSFHIDDARLGVIQNMHDVQPIYRLGMKFRAVQADSGATAVTLAEFTCWRIG